MNAARRWPIVSVAIGTIATAVLAVPGAAPVLELRTGADAAAWRWITGHLTHFGASHGAWDIAVFVALGAAIEARSRTRLGFVLLTSAIAVSAAMHVGVPELTHYRGLSGVDSALFGALVIDAIRGTRAMRTLAWVVVTGFALKLGYEWQKGATMFVATTREWTPIPLAHLVGFGAGVASALSATALRTRATMRASVHEERGEERLDSMLRLHAGHDLVHCRQIARIVRAVTEDSA